MNSFENNRDIEVLKAVNPVAGRAEPSEDLMAAAFAKAQVGMPAKLGRNGRTFRNFRLGQFSLPQLSFAGAALATFVAIAVTVGTLPAGNHYLITTGGAAASGAKSKVAGYGSMLQGSAATASDMMMMPNYGITYTAATDLSDQTGSGHIYEITAAGSPKETADALANFFGIPGGISKVSDSNSDWVTYVPTRDNQGSTASATDTVAPATFWVTGSKTYVSFGYNDNMAYNWQTCQQPMTPLPDYCTGIQKEELPSLSSAANQVKQILDALGAKWGTTASNTPEGGYLVDPTYQDQFSGIVASDAVTTFSATTDTAPEQPSQSAEKMILVTATLMVAGNQSPIQMQFSWLPGYAKIASISGELAKAIDKGPFNTISAKDAVARLNSFGYGGQTTLDWQNVKWSTKTNPDSSTQLRSAVEACNPNLNQTQEAASSEVPAESPSATAWAVAAGVTDACTLPLKNGIPQIEARVTRAQHTQIMIWDSGNTRWLVPGFNFYDETGYLASAFSVEDGIIKIDAPTMQPMTK